MMLVVLSESHSSIGKLKKVRQASMDRSRVLTAEGSSFAHFDLKCSKDPRAFYLDGA